MKTFVLVLLLATATSLTACGGGGGGAAGPADGGGDPGGGSGSSGGSGGSGPPGPGDVDQLFPDTVGDEWRFFGTTATNGTEPARGFFNTRVAAGTLALGPRIATGFHESQPYEGAPPGTTYESRDTNAAWRDANVPDNLLEAPLLPYRLARFPLLDAIVDSRQVQDVVLGADFDGDGRSERLDAAVETRFAGHEPITVDAGDFPAAAIFSVNVTGTVRGTLGGTGQFAWTETTWRVPGVGPVKRTLQTLLGETRYEDEHRLRGYRVAGQQRGLGQPVQLFGDLAPSNSDTETPGRPAIASDGSRFLVASRRRTGTQIATPLLKYVAVLVGPDGSPGAEFDLSAPRPWVGEFDLSMAYGQGVYAIVFPEPDESTGRATLNLQRVSADGTLLEPPGGHVLASYPANLADVAFGGGVFLVVYGRFVGPPDYLTRIYGVLVAPDGSVVRPEFPIATAFGPTAYPRVAHDGSVFMVAWTGTVAGGAPTGSDGRDIVGRRIGTDGTLLDAANIAISTAAEAQQRVALAASPGQFLVAWQDARSYPGTTDRFDMRAARVAGDGTLLDGPPATGGMVLNEASGTWQRGAAAAFTGTEYVVAWATNTYAGLPGPSPGIYATRIGTDGTRRRTPPAGIFASGTPPMDAAEFDWPAIAAGDSAAMLAWFSTVGYGDPPNGPLLKAVNGVLVYPSAP